MPIPEEDRMNADVTVDSTNYIVRGKVRPPDTLKACEVMRGHATFEDEGKAAFRKV